MKEQFCTYEIALALKELGFDEKCFAYYNYEEDFYLCDNVKMIKYAHKYHKEDESVLAPLWQQAIDWFDKKGIIIEIVKDPALRNIGNHSFTFCVYQKTKESFFNPVYVTRYEAREAAILKCIELCQKENDKL